MGHRDLGTWWGPVFCAARKTLVHGRLHLYRKRRYSLRSSTEMLILLAHCSFSFRKCFTAQCMTVMSFLRPRLAGAVSVFTHDLQ